MGTRQALHAGLVPGAGNIGYLAGMTGWLGIIPFLVFQGLHADAIDRARRHAQFAAGALIRQHSVHLLVRTQDGVHRAGLDTQGASYAPGFVDNGKHLGTDGPMGGIERHIRPDQQLSQRPDAGIATRWTLVDASFARCQRFRIRAAALVAALGALRLRQDGINMLGECGHSVVCFHESQNYTRSLDKSIR